MGVSLYSRDLHNISLKLRAANEIISYNILQLFPFTSESKMMGIIVQVKQFTMWLIFIFNLFSLLIVKLMCYGFG